VHATAGFFYVSNIPEIIPSTEEAYREHVLPLCFRGSTAEEDAIIASLFSAKSDAKQRYYRVTGDKFELL